MGWKIPEAINPVGSVENLREDMIRKAASDVLDSIERNFVLHDLIQPKACSGPARAFSFALTVMTVVYSSLLNKLAQDGMRKARIEELLTMSIDKVMTLLIAYGSFDIPKEQGKKGKGGKRDE